MCVCGCGWVSLGMCGCALVCGSVQVYAGMHGCWVCMGGCVWDEFSEFLLETRILTSTDFNMYPIRIFILKTDSRKSVT